MCGSVQWNGPRGSEEEGGMQETCASVSESVFFKAQAEIGSVIYTYLGTHEGDGSLINCENLLSLISRH